MSMRKQPNLVGVVLAAILVPTLLLATSIRIAPNVLNIGSSGTVVTVHTDLPFSSVVGASVTLNGVGIDWWKSDARGNFVAKFSMSDVKALVNSGDLPLGSVTLTLEGTTTSGDGFLGSAEITIIDR